jgi:energy-coupling factor transport system permease protein
VERKALMRSPVHPMAWWVWAISLSIALFISGDAWFAAGLVVASAILVRELKTDHPWSRSFAVAMRFVALIIAIRMMIAIVIGVPIPGTTLVTLPTAQLPDWISGIRIGGPVTLERLSSTLAEVMVIVGVVALFATATTLTSPHRMIRSLPVAFYQLGLILTISTSVFPQLVASIERITMARKLRGQQITGLRHWRKIAMPLLEESLERSLDLAAAMESRGFGQRRFRSMYRPDPWGSVENLILFTSIAIAALLFLSPYESAITSMGIGVLAASSLINLSTQRFRRENRGK